MEMFLLTCEDLLVTIFFIVQTFFPPYNRFFLSSSEQAIDKMCRQTRAVRIRVRWRSGKGIPGASLGPWAQAPSSQGWAVLCPPALHPEAVSAERWMWEEDLLPGLGNLHPHLRNSSGRDVQFDRQPWSLWTHTWILKYLQQEVFHLLITSPIFTLPLSASLPDGDTLKALFSYLNFTLRATANW